MNDETRFRLEVEKERRQAIEALRDVWVATATIRGNPRVNVIAKNRVAQVCALTLFDHDALDIIGAIRQNMTADSVPWDIARWADMIRKPTPQTIVASHVHHIIAAVMVKMRMHP